MSWWDRLGFFLFRNRYLIGISSLVWLIWRSGAQPRRLAYPCQQAAAANVGALAVLLIPVLARRRQRWRPGLHRTVHVVAGAILVAGLLSVLMTSGGTAYTWLMQPSPSLSDLGELPPPRSPADKGLAVEGGLSPPVPTRVAIVQDNVHSLTNARIESMVREAVQMAGGLSGIVQPGHTVVLKPNLVVTSSPPGDGITTHPAVTRALVKMAREAGATRVIIADGTASSRYGEDMTRLVTWKAFKDSGYDADGNRRDDETDAELVDLNDTGGIGQYDPAKVRLVTIPNGVIRTQYWVPRVLLKPADGGICDVLIAVPCYKNHYNNTISLCLKGRVGCAPNDIYHALFAPYTQQLKWSLVHSVTSNFPRTVSDGGPYPVPPYTTVENAIVQYTVVDLNLVRPHDFAVVEALVGVTNGPVGDMGTGMVTKANPERRMIIAGRDSVAVDTVGALTMGYNPLVMPHLAWSAERAMGTADVRDIQVVGRRVSQVRLDFPSGYGDAVRAESVPPVLGQVSINDGDRLHGMVTVSATGAGDNVGLAKAELTLRRTDSPNLLINGDFETGDSTGWTPWQSSWGDNFVRVFNDTTAGRSGQYCLRLGNAATTGSFGVYQQVPVTPGRMYRVDARWRGQKLGEANWFELLVIDGPFDMAKADSGGEPLVRTSYMYAYDNLINTGVPGPIGTTFGWYPVREDNGTPRDYNGRLGVRIASGNTLTVVLKAGTLHDGVAMWFDEVTLVEVPAEEIVATAVNPGSSFDLVFDAGGLPQGPYEARVTVYDASLNEASITRQVLLAPPLTPLIGVNPATITRSLAYGTSPPPDDSFTVTNLGIGTLNYQITVDQSWLSVTPAWGTSTGEADPILVRYHTDSLPPGQYSATVVVSDPAAYNSPRTVTVLLTVTTPKPDFDLDGDVDLDDFAHLQTCMSGMGVVQNLPACQDARLDGDTDVDGGDLARFRACLSGAGIPAEPGCMPPP